MKKIYYILTASLLIIACNNYTPTQSNATEKSVESLAERIRRISSDWSLDNRIEQEIKSKEISSYLKYVTEKNCNKIKEIFSNLDNQENSIKLYVLGMCYIETGNEDEQNKGKDYLYKAARLGNIEAQTRIMDSAYEMAKRKYDKEAIQEIFKWAKKASEADYAQPQHMLLKFMFEEKQPNCTEIKYWADRSVKQGIWWDSSGQRIGNYPPLQYIQASLRAHGICYSEDNQAVFDWAMKSAKQGYPDGEALVGVCFLEGVGVKQDHRKAKEWLIKASKHGSSFAPSVLKELGINMEKEIFTKK